MATPYFLSMINPAIVVMGALFLIFFALLVYILSKVFRDKYGNVSTVTVGIISFCISVLIIYFGRDTIYNIIDSLRLSNMILYVLSGAAILILLYLFRKKLKFYIVLMLAGAGLILIGALTDWFYQKWFVILFGIIILLLGIWLCSRRRGRTGRGFRGRTRRGNEGQTQQPGQQRGTRRRDVYDLKQKYMAYLFEYYRKGITPQRQRRIKQAMQTIIITAGRMGCSQRRFLSNEIAGQRAKSPRELR